MKSEVAQYVYCKGFLKDVVAEIAPTTRDILDHRRLVRDLIRGYNANIQSDLHVAVLENLRSLWGF